MPESKEKEKTTEKRREKKREKTRGGTIKMQGDKGTH